MTNPANNSWLAQRTAHFDSSGIRKMFALGAKLKDPINLSIGQPDFMVPEQIKEDICRFVKEDRNAYTPTEGILPLRTKLSEHIIRKFGNMDGRSVLVTSGTSGALTLTLLATINPGDEVIFFDPYFVMYPALVGLAGGVSIPISTYPDFRIDLDKVHRAITPRTKMIIVNSPGNPTGVCASEDELKGLARLADQHNLCLVSDEIYSHFCFSEKSYSPLLWNPNTIVIDGLSKSHAMTGLRLGFLHGPRFLVDAIAELQQFTFVNAPTPVQWAAIEGLNINLVAEVERYRANRDFLVNELSPFYEIVVPSGAFYAFPRLPPGHTGESFQSLALDHQLMIIPGNIFSRQDTHFRMSFAVNQRILERGVDVLRKLARDRR